MQPYLTVTDYSVSGKPFELMLDVEADMLITTPKPSPDELPAFYESDDYISHTDGKRSAFERIYQLIRKVALRRKLRMISRYQRPGMLLDIGAGTGDFAMAAKARGWTVAGAEPNPKARAMALAKGLNLQTETAHFGPHEFDVITMWHVLEHVYDLPAQVHELKWLLKPSGTIFIAVPNFKSFDARKYNAYWAAYDVPRHLWHFSRQAVSAIFEPEGFEVRNVIGMPFDAYYVSLLSEKYKTGKMRVIPALMTGFRSNWKARRSGEYSSLIYVITPKNKPHEPF